ncbi:MAG: cell division protein ZapE, partial [Myxococcaceae bacterium]
WRDMLGKEEETGAVLEVLGRKIAFPHAAGGLLRASFASLCEVALGPNDYVALAERFHTVFLADVPRLTPANREAATARTSGEGSLSRASSSSSTPTGFGSFAFVAWRAWVRSFTPWDRRSATC